MQIISARDLLRNCVVASIVALLSTLSNAKTQCRNERFEAATAIHALPSEIVTALQQGELADRGHDFQIGDVVSDPPLPKRRLVIGALSASRAFIAVERGGYFRTVELWEFTMVKRHWTSVRSDLAPYAPDSLQELLYMACDGVSKPPANIHPLNLTSGAENSDGTISLAFADRKGIYLLAPLAEQRTGDCKIRDLQNDRVLGMAERVELLKELRRRQQKSEMSDATRLLVGKFIACLNENP